MFNLKLPALTAYLILLTGFTMALLSYLGFIQQLAESLALRPYIIITAVMLIPVTAFIHIPIRRVQVVHAIPQSPIQGLIIPKRSLYRGHTLIAVNFGGAILPLSYSIALFIYFPIPVTTLLLIISIVCITSYILSRPIPGFGIGLPLFSSPIVTALATHYIVDEHQLSTAYIAGTIGVMLGADLLRLKDIKQLGSSFVSIGGAGILDSIVLTGFISIVLVSLF